MAEPVFSICPRLPLAAVLHAAPCSSARRSFCISTRVTLLGWSEVSAVLSMCPCFFLTSTHRAQSARVTGARARLRLARYRVGWDKVLVLLLGQRTCWRCFWRTSPVLSYQACHPGVLNNLWVVGQQPRTRVLFPPGKNIKGVWDVDHSHAFHGMFAVLLCLMKEARFYFHL